MCIVTVPVTEPECSPVMLEPEADCWASQGPVRAHRLSTLRLKLSEQWLQMPACTQISASDTDCLCVSEDTTIKEVCQVVLKKSDPAFVRVDQVQIGSDLSPSDDFWPSSHAPDPCCNGESVTNTQQCTLGECEDCRHFTEFYILQQTG